MKPSIYNMFLRIPGNESEQVLFNTLTGAMLFVDHELKDTLQGGVLEKIDGESTETLSRLGIIVQDNVDERKVFDYKNRRRSYSSRDAQFTLAPTMTCNLACPYCYEGSGQIYTKSMDDKMVGRVVAALQKYVIRNGNRNLGVTLYGGEPLLNQKACLQFLDQLSRWARGQGMHFSGSMITNGTLTTDKLAETFSGYLSMVQVTLDGPKEFHDKRRIYKNKGGTFDDVLKSIQLWRDRDVPVSLRIQVSKENYRSIGSLLDTLRNLGFHKDNRIRAYIFPLMALNNVCCSIASLYVEDEEEANILPAVWTEAAGKGFHVVSKPVQAYDQPYCSFTNRHYYIIDAGGDVYKCVSLIGDEKHRVARVGENEDLVDLKPELYEFMGRDPLQIKACRNCHYLPLCAGGCAYLAHTKHSTYQAPDCTMHKKLEDVKVLMYASQLHPEKFKNERNRGEH